MLLTHIQVWKKPKSLCILIHLLHRESLCTSQRWTVTLGIKKLPITRYSSEINSVNVKVSFIYVQINLPGAFILTSHPQESMEQACWIHYLFLILILQIFNSKLQVSKSSFLSSFTVFFISCSFNSLPIHHSCSLFLSFPGGSDGKESACNAGDPSLIPGLARSPGEGNGNPLQYSCLKNSMSRRAW